MTYDPKDVAIDVVSDTGFYIIRERTDEGYKPITVPGPPGEEEIHAWTLSLNDTQLEAMRKIFWDRWTFIESTGDVKMVLDALELERNRRRLKHSTFAAGIF